MRAAPASTTGSRSDAPVRPATQFLLSFMRENGRQPTALEAFEGGQRHEQRTHAHPARAAVTRLSASERDTLYVELQRFESHFKGRCGFFALDSLMSLLLSMELEEAEELGLR
jgi:hypothetical protein